MSKYYHIELVDMEPYHTDDIEFMPGGWVHDIEHNHIYPPRRIFEITVVDNYE